MIGVLIGNGESRKGFPLESLHARPSITYGCNALYRDFAPDVLFVGDAGMASEIQQSYTGLIAQVDREGCTVKLNNCTVAPSATIPLPKSRSGYKWLTGIAAAYVMCHLHENLLSGVFLLGFDGYQTQTVNNVYKGTENYLNATEQQTGIARNVRSMQGLVFELFPQLKFYRVGHEDEPVKNPWDLPNVNFISYTDFKKSFLTYATS